MEKGYQESHLQRIFERFYRIDKSGRKEGGSGLGLSIVKHIIEAHGEKIHAESVVDVGSGISFTLEKSKKQSAEFPPHLSYSVALWRINS